MLEQSIKTLEAKVRRIQDLLDNYEDVLDSISPILFAEIEDKKAECKIELSRLYTLQDQE